jgi:hypothetical protein
LPVLPVDTEGYGLRATVALLVEDDEDARTMLASALRSWKMPE